MPYRDVLRPGAPYKGEDILQDLTTILCEFRPTRVIVSHPADHNSDHRALYLFTRVALWNLEPNLQPELYPYLVHYRHWPLPRGDRPTELLRPPSALSQAANWYSLPLSTNQVELKEQAIRAHRSQFTASSQYLLSFIRGNELFGKFPVVLLRAETTSEAGAELGTPATAEMAPSDELTPEEREAFVGLESETIRRDGNSLLVSIRFSRPLAREVTASFYLFGFRRGRPFGEMPKLHVRLGELASAVYDQARPLPRETVPITRGAHQIVLRVPLRVLGDPERILISGRTAFGEVPLDWTAWRVVIP